MPQTTRSLVAARADARAARKERQKQQASQPPRLLSPEQQECAKDVVNALLLWTGAIDIVQSGTLSIEPVGTDNGIHYAFNATANPYTAIPSLTTPSGERSFFPVPLPDPTNRGIPSFRGTVSPSLELTPTPLSSTREVTGDVDFRSVLTDPLGHLRTDVRGRGRPEPCALLQQLINQGRAPL